MAFDRSSKHPNLALLVVVVGVLITAVDTTILGGVAGPFAGRFADRRGAVLPATAGLGMQVFALVAYAQLGLSTPLWVVVAAYMVGAFGSGCFFPSNNSAVMKAAPGDEFGIASGLLRTFANVGMVFSFALAILIASATITKQEAFAVFVGTATLSHPTAAAFTDGIQAAFYASTSLMAVAAVLSATRARCRPLPLLGPEAATSGPSALSHDGDADGALGGERGAERRDGPAWSDSRPRHCGWDPDHDRHR